MPTLCLLDRLGHRPLWLAGSGPEAALVLDPRVGEKAAEGDLGAAQVLWSGAKSETAVHFGPDTQTEFALVDPDGPWVWFSILDGVRQFQVARLGRLVSAGWTLVDVREQHEWDAGRIPGAVLCPMSRFSEWADRFGPSDRVLLQCRSGRRSQDLARLLLARGVVAANLAGGILAWNQIQNPTEQA